MTRDNGQGAPAALVISKLNAFYGTAHVLFDIDLTVKTGNTLALLGRNGAGKTTLLRSIARGLVRTTGSVTYGERRLHEMRPDQVARCGVQLVPEDRRIFASLTVAENLQLGHHAAHRRAPVELSEVLEMLPLLRPLLKRKGYQLSGGEQQLVAIARAIVGRPQLLLLDEPSEGLAPRIVDDVGAGLRSIQEHFPITVILAEQNLNFALRIADDVCVIDDGRVAFKGGVQEFDERSEIRDRYLKI